MKKKVETEAANGGPSVPSEGVTTSAPPRQGIPFSELFAWHPPTDEQRPKYQQLQIGFMAVVERAKASFAEATYGVRADQDVFDNFTKTVTAYAELIEELCPPSADRTAALRCLRLAHNAVNDILCGAKHWPNGLSQEPYKLIVVACLLLLIWAAVERLVAPPGAGPEGT